MISHHKSRRSAMTLLGFAAVLGMAACSDRSAPDASAETFDNQMSVEVPLDAPVAAPPATLNDSAAADAPAPVIDTTERDAQMLEDADATGMTARLPAGDDSAPAANAAENQR